MPLSLMGEAPRIGPLKRRPLSLSAAAAANRREEACRGKRFMGSHANRHRQTPMIA